MIIEIGLYRPAFGVLSFYAIVLYVCTCWLCLVLHKYNGLETYSYVPWMPIICLVHLPA